MISSSKFLFRASVSQVFNCFPSWYINYVPCNSETANCTHETYERGVITSPTLLSRDCIVPTIEGTNVPSIHIPVDLVRGEEVKYLEGSFNVERRCFTVSVCDSTRCRKFENFKEGKGQRTSLNCNAIRAIFVCQRFRTPRYKSSAFTRRYERYVERDIESVKSEAR